MILTSKTTGTQGQIAYSATGDMLSLDVLSQSQDATVIIGNSTSANPIVVSSSSHTLSNVVPGLTLNLLSTSDSPVQVTVEQDIDTIVSNVKTFIKTYNDALDQIRTSTKYIPNEDDPTKSERGVLLGEATVRTVESQITRLVTATVSNIDSTLKQLGDVGIMVDSTGGQTQLTLSRTLGADSNNSTTIDGEAKLRAALRENPEAVKKRFTLVETNDNKEPVYTGLAARMEQELGRITRQVDGTLTREYDKLQNRVDLLQEQASDMEDLLAKKEARLYKQFQSMETALANLQTQQSALSALSSLTNISSYSYSNSK